MQMAFEEGLVSILVEGGQKLASALLEAGYVNRIYLFYGNRILGNGIDGLKFGEGLPLSKAIRLKQHTVITIDDTIMVTGIPERK